MIQTTPRKILISILIIFPFTTLAQGLPMMGAVNKLLIAVLSVLLILCLILDKTSVRTLVFLVLTAFLTLFMFVYDRSATSIAIGRFGSSGVNIYFYFPVWVLYFLFLQKNFNAVILFIRENLALLNIVCLAWNALTAISFFFPSSYTYKWGGGVYFASFSTGEHRYASSCIFLMVLAWLLYLHTKKLFYFAYVLLPVVGVFMCGARTYLGVAALILVCMYYSIFENKTLFYITLPPMALVLVVVTLISPMGEKVLSTLSGEGYGGFWFVLTNSRSLVWAVDMRYFLDFNLWHKLVGSGAGLSYAINYAHGFGPVWAHNDFIQLLLSNGIIGLCMYFAVSLGFTIPQIRRQKAQEKIPFFTSICFYMAWFINAFFNGAYFYSCAMLMIPFMLYGMFFQEDIKAWMDGQKSPDLPPSASSQAAPHFANTL